MVRITRSSSGSRTPAFHSADCCCNTAEGNGYLVGKRLLLFYLPFTLCFIIPNFVKMAPWIWDNIKVFITGGSHPRRWSRCCWRGSGDVANSALVAALLFVVVTLAGALDVAGIALREETKYGVFDAEGVLCRAR